MVTLGGKSCDVMSSVSTGSTCGLFVSNTAYMPFSPSAGRATHFYFNHLYNIFNSLLFFVVVRCNKTHTQIYNEEEIKSKMAQSVRVFCAISK